MKTLALATALLVAGTAAAEAQRSGTYSLSGTNADGGSYQGVLELAPTGLQTWRVTWRFGNQTVIGTGMTLGNLLVVG